MGALRILQLGIGKSLRIALPFLLCQILFEFASKYFSIASGVAMKIHLGVYGQILAVL